MPDFLCVSVRFVSGAYHGRADYGEPEWPPSPMRLYQAIVAASAARWNERCGLRHAEPALREFEKLRPPVIVAPAAREAQGYLLYVPDNIGDLVGASWASGGEGKVAKNRPEKPVRPLAVPDEMAVHFLWNLADAPAGFAEHHDVIFAAVRSITHLGWGVDMVVADASVISEEDAEKLPGIRWQPIEGDSRNALRVPLAGTLDDLNKRYAAFLQRARPEGFHPIPSLSRFRLISYLKGTEPPALPFAAFTFLTPSADGMRSFDLVRNGMRVAGMMRHAAGEESVAVALGWPDEKVREMIHGHAEPEGAAHQPTNGPRFAFIPVPSIEPRGKGRALVVASARRAILLGVRGASRNDVQNLARLLAGQPLMPEGADKPAAILARLPEADAMVSRYTGEATTWATVTPVILPGYDDPRKLRRALSPQEVASSESLDVERQKRLLATLDRRTDFLLRKAIRQAGFPDELAKHAEIDWSGSGFWPGTDLAGRYAIPSTLRRFRRLHVRITWKDPTGHAIPIHGPICFGSGRFVGLGLLAPLSNS